MLSRNEFESAVKQALRNYQRADQLRHNPLLRARILARRSGGAAPVGELPVLLAEASGRLFAGARDQKYHRVLDLTYFNPAPKQEAAADRLGLPFSTYRRHLTTGIDRLTEWLWHQEKEAEQAGTETGNAVAGGVGGGTAKRLSVAVLPFLNLAHDRESDYLAAAIADSLITDLSRAIPGSFVVSRSTAFTYRDRPMPAPQIGRELGVRYVLEGSMLADERHVRVNVQLTDVEASESMWAERFDKERSDILRVQEEIVARLCRSVGIEMIRQEAVRGGSGDGPDAIDLVMRGKALAIDLRHPGNAEQAIAHFQQALEIEPDNVDALAGIAATRIYQIVNRYRVDAREELLQEAEGLIGRAMVLAPYHIGVLKAHGVLLRARGRFAEAVAATHAVIERNPGEPTAYREIGLNKLYLGEAEEAAMWFRRADRIAPQDPVRWTWLQGLARALIHLGHYAEAVEATRLTIAHNPGNVRFRALLAAAEALAGNEPEAKRHLAEYAAIEPGMTIDRFVERQSALPLHLCSRAYLRQSNRILEGLRLAGMPDG